MLAGNEFQSLGRAVVKEDEYEELARYSVRFGSTRRIDIIAFKESTRFGFIIDPTVRFETNEEQPAEMDNEKKNIYNPTIPYYLQKYQLEELEVIGLLVGARVAIGLFEHIEQRFLLSGHSFLQCDSDFALIEKRQKVTKAFILSDLLKIVQDSKVVKPFQTVSMLESYFLNMQNVADQQISIKNLNISKACCIHYDVSKAGSGYVKQSHDNEAVHTIKVNGITSDPVSNLLPLANLYMKRVKIRIGEEMSQESEIWRGIRQRCPLSPTLFNIYWKDLVKNSFQNMGGVLVGGVRIKCIRLADDMALLAEEEMTLRNMLLELNGSFDHVALYGAETWTLRRSEVKQIEVFEMWVWRRMELVKLCWKEWLKKE
ncbi:hypothetical protein ANN_06827 [Periplaneta americana]|uniref:Reverse transcriptase domain-containing protein n=1 Tax=Periplaneta americana TaxID=6978 RepID=A0ABQ8TFG7_PERAM|nr:hypothetical protein ANN_06827 [Periplaneta americana]